MSILHATRPQVKPLSPARSIIGRYITPAALSAIILVALPNGRTGYQVGPLGMIFAEKSAAARFAAGRDRTAAEWDAMAADAAMADEADRFNALGCLPC